jgi:hypothetical protein
MTIKSALEAKLGTLTDERVDFAIEQFERNVENIRRNRGFGTGSKMTTAEYLNELAMNIDFYNRHAGRCSS